MRKPLGEDADKDDISYEANRRAKGDTIPFPSYKFVLDREIVITSYQLNK